MASVPFSLEGDRHDQSTFLGRVKHFFEMIDPQTLWMSEKDVNSAIQLLKDFENGQRSPNTTNEDLWEARRIRDAIFHPQTGEAIFPAFRMSSFVPMNVPIAAGMLLSAPTVRNAIFWQWLNQSYNAGFNYSNRNTSNSDSTSQILKSYLSATAVSCAVAVGLGQFVKRSSSFSPTVRSIIQRCVPYTAVATAGIFNAVVMRLNEAYDGINVTDEKGEVVGKSAIAGKQALTQVAVTRAALPVTGLLLPNFVIHSLQQTKFLRSNPSLRVPVELGVITIFLAGALPLAIGLFPQISALSAKELEPQVIEQLEDKLQRKINAQDVVYYNKGI